MKTEINKLQEPKGFKPFEFNITVETVQEARLLFHVFNHPDLKDAIFENYDTNCNYNMVDNFSGSGGVSKIHIEVKSQGFEV